MLTSFLPPQLKNSKKTYDGGDQVILMGLLFGELEFGQSQCPISHTSYLTTTSFSGNLIQQVHGH